MTGKMIGALGRAQRWASMTYTSLRLTVDDAHMCVYTLLEKTYSLHHHPTPTFLLSHVVTSLYFSNPSNALPPPPFTPWGWDRRPQLDSLG